VSRRRATTNDRGAIVVIEVVLWTLVFTLVLSVVVYCGREPLVRGQVDRAAKVAAEEAASHRTKAAAVQAAHEAALANLEQDGIGCRSLDVTLDLSDWRPGGVVRANVSCDVELADLVRLGLPVGVPMSSRFPATIDTHKALA
jgi:hypothetical protein